MKIEFLKLFFGIFFTLLFTRDGFSQFVLDSVFIRDSVKFPFRHLVTDHVYNDTLQFSTVDYLQTCISGQLQTSTPGGLTTFLHRGLGNRHLPVLWNGINIQSVINGSYDLSLIPANLYNGLHFYTTGNPALNGNNGITGTLDIKRIKSDNPIEITTGISSLQNYSLSVHRTFHHKKYSGFAGLEYAYDRNIFMYTDGLESLKRSPTDLKKLNIIYQGNYYPNEKQMISIDIWYQRANRNIPVSTTSAFLLQQQNDINLRLKVGHVWLLNHYKITSGFTAMDEQLDFSTPLVNSFSKVNVYIANVELTGRDHQNYHVSIQNRFDQANPNFYTESKTRSTWQIAFSKYIKKGNYTGNFSFRQDLTDQNLMPSSFSLLNQYKKISLQISRNYSLPGFNDLYWPSGGNASLRTEKSLQSELKSQAIYHKIVMKAAVYINHVNDWIQWVPQASGQWSAVNQKSVLSRGFECNINKSYDASGWKIIPEISYSFNKTTALDHYFDKKQIGKQLIYIPQHKLITQLKFANSSHHFQISYQLTGKRYDTTDLASALPGIHLTDVAYTYVQKKYRFNFAVNNLLNYKYDLIRYFPMPGVHAEMNWTFSIN